MGASVLKASIKKIEIVNKTTKKEWQQSVRIILGDIELNNESFLALRKFRPDETVAVSIDSVDEERHEDFQTIGSEMIEEGEKELSIGERIERRFNI